MNKNDLRYAIVSILSDEARWAGLKKFCDPPIFAVQRAEHPAFAELARLIPGHATPCSLLKNRVSTSGEWSVVSLAFPSREWIVRESALVSGFPPKSWFEGKVAAMNGMASFAACLVAVLRADGVETLNPPSPGDGVFVARLNESGARYDTTWSERHVAYATGLGTFGLHGAIITDAGCVHRLKSLLIRARFDEFDSVNEHPFGNCLYCMKKTCGACIGRCPTGAVSEQGHDPVACEEHAKGRNSQRVRDEYGLDVPGCALCMNGIPCSRRNPMKTGVQ